MKHVLDNPAWNALISGNKPLASGTGPVRYFDSEVSPFAALEDNSEDNLKQLYQQLPDNRLTLFITPAEMTFSAQWEVLRSIKGLQMVYDAVPKQDSTAAPIVPLTDKDVPQMLGLTKLTNPGPFDARTIDFGHYEGIFDGAKLVAMAGQRMHPFEFAEVSAVCTHPEYTGRGYSRQLLLSQVNRIKAATEIPFLHVRYDNDRAIKVYQSLGFATRREVNFYVLKKV